MELLRRHAPKPSPNLEPSALPVDLERLRQLIARTAAKQEATRQLVLLLTEAERLATVLRFGVREHYGIRSEKLAEFGQQPFRGLKRKPKPAPATPGAPSPEPTPPPSSPEAPSGPVS